MDDTYIWTTCALHMQMMLNRLQTNLPPKGLDIHPEKTEIVDNQGGGVSKLGNSRSLAKDPST